MVCIRLLVLFLLGDLCIVGEACPFNPQELIIVFILPTRMIVLCCRHIRNGDYSDFLCLSRRVHIVELFVLGLNLLLKTPEVVTGGLFFVGRGRDRVFLGDEG